MYFSIFRKVFVLFIYLFFAHSVWTQEVYTQLHKQSHVQTFTEISNGLVCQCGCNFVLSVCPHVECPWGIPARRFIEIKVREGASTQEILHGFRHGFQSTMLEEDYIKKMIKEGHGDIVEELILGYGPKVLARTSLFFPLLLISLLILFGFIVLSYWLKRNRKFKIQVKGL